MSIINIGGKTLGALALVSVIGVGFAPLGCGRSDTPAQDAASGHGQMDMGGHEHGAATAPEAKAPVGNAQTTCPILGGKINKAIFADYQGKRVYFCCAGCPETFKKDPAKYIKEMEDKGIVLDKTPEGATSTPGAMN